MTVDLGLPNGALSNFYCIDNSSNPVTVNWFEQTATDTFVVAFATTPFSGDVMFGNGTGLAATATIPSTPAASGCYHFLVVNCSSTQCAWLDPRLVVKGGSGTAHGGKGK